MTRTYTKSAKKVASDNRRRVIPVEEYENLVAMYKDGDTLAQIGERYGVSRERIRQLLKGKIESRSGGSYLSTTARRMANLRDIIKKKEKRIQEKYGCTLEQYSMIRKIPDGYIIRTPIDAYRTQKDNAKTRGIEWDLTLWEWWCVWDDSGHYFQRGTGREGYVMSRKNDVGIYDIENVEIVLGLQNNLDYYEIHGEDHAKIIKGRKR